MTSDVLPFPNVVSASSEVLPAYYAFNKKWSQSIGWAGNPGPQWIKYDFGAGTKWACSGYTIQADWNGGDVTPTSWTLEGSNDNLNWTILDSKVGQTWTINQIRHYAISNTTPYRYYRWNNLYGNANYTEFQQLTIEAPVLFFGGMV